MSGGGRKATTRLEDLREIQGLALEEVVQLLLHEFRIPPEDLVVPAWKEDRCWWHRRLSWPSCRTHMKGCSPLGSTNCSWVTFSSRNSPKATVNSGFMKKSSSLSRISPSSVFGFARVM